MEDAAIVVQHQLFEQDAKNRPNRNRYKECWSDLNGLQRREAIRIQENDRQQDQIAGGVEEAVPRG